MTPIWTPGRKKMATAVTFFTPYGVQATADGGFIFSSMGRIFKVARSGMVTSIAELGRCHFNYTSRELLCSPSDIELRIKSLALAAKDTALLWADAGTEYTANFTYIETGGRIMRLALHG